MSSYSPPATFAQPTVAASSRWLILAVISLAQLMLILDTTIVSIALPSLQLDLGMSDANRQWVITAYTLTFGGLLLLGGRVASYLGSRNALIVGLIGFALASAIGGAANNQELLIGHARCKVCSERSSPRPHLAVLTTTFTTPADRAKAFGIFGALGAGGAAVGLLSGGLLTEYLNWRWCFYVNIPLAIISIVGALRLMSSGRAFQINGRLDVVGAVLGTGGLFALVFGFNQAEVHGWSDSSTIMWLAGSVVLLTAFVFSQQRAEHPILPLRLLTDRNRAAAYGASVGAPFALFGMFFFLTYYLQVVQNFSPVRTGLAFIPQTVAIIIGSQIAVRLMNRVAPRIPIVTGFGLVAAGLLLLTRLEVDSTYLGLVSARPADQRSWRGADLRLGHEYRSPRRFAGGFRSGGSSPEHLATDRRVDWHQSVEHAGGLGDRVLHRQPQW